ncbi:DUF6171 family protein [Paenibacillus sp. XY044]|uniref:DUF6171 family protein n=1 Tax=Paenibacillus sp. XY044 TaxID=2026089 RepID=UPI000B9849D8|nr:DUF6171 family protein [Paenibacillus sp. XY044]OZB90908.1 hypothetical protein CJP46_31345 [Paenibacillus sp. XY044]
MERQEGCKGCSESVQVSPEKLQRIVEIATRGREKVPEEKYNRRIEQCEQCPGLQYGTTCQYCGCLVAVKARLLESACPYPFAPKWS